MIKHFAIDAKLETKKKKRKEKFNFIFSYKTRCP